MLMLCSGVMVIPSAKRTPPPQSRDLHCKNVSHNVISNTVQLELKVHHGRSPSPLLPQQINSEVMLQDFLKVFFILLIFIGFLDFTGFFMGYKKFYINPARLLEADLGQIKWLRVLVSNLHTVSLNSNTAYLAQKHL